MKNFLLIITLAATAYLLMGAAVQASLIVDAYYHLGEKDPGAVAGNPGNDPTVDSAAIWDLNKFGTTTYSADVDARAAAKASSSLSMAFSAANSSHYTESAGVPTSATDNFGIEGWFKLDDLSQQGLAVNGTTWESGFALYVINQRLYGLYGAVAALDSGISLPTNTWFYAGLVRDNGNTTMYYGTGGPLTAVGVGAAAPNAGTYGATVGAAGGWSSYYGGERFQDYLNGKADEVRIFTFEPGQFSTNDLLYNVPEPSTLLLLVAGLAGMAAMIWRKGK